MSGTDGAAEAASGGNGQVFISYAHDDAAHVDRVRSFWIFLRANGIDAIVDLPIAERRADWTQWMSRQVRDASRILVVASPAYRERAEGDAPPGTGRGVQWEAALIRERIYADQAAGLDIVLPVVLPGCSAGDIPLWLRPLSVTYYVVSDCTVEGAAGLLRALTGQPWETAPPLGNLPVLPPRGHMRPEAAPDRLKLEGTGVAGRDGWDPVADFCRDLAGLHQASGLSRSELATRLGCSRRQFDVVLDGRAVGPPDWDRLVEPLVRECAGGDAGVLEEWRRRHGFAVRAHAALSQVGPAGSGRQIVPAQLPARVTAFTGRGGELAALDRMLDGAEELLREGVGAVIAVCGSAGIGKTALAVRWSHQVRDRFPDGQLYVNLRGYDPQGTLPVEDALAGCLRALGVPGDDIPPGAEECAALFRTEMADRQMLVLLDNALDTEHVRPLLPGGGRSLAVVTSRDSLAGLVALHGAQRIELDLLPDADAVGLLSALIGPRVAAERETASAFAKRCARLPLALRVAAELAASRPLTSLAEITGELARQQPLDVLDAGGDPRAAIRTVFSWSYARLPDDASRMFRLMGLHPGSVIDAFAAAALAGCTADRARTLLERLARASLVMRTRNGRYEMHDLLRSFAASLTPSQDQAAEVGAALSRLADYYVGTAAAAMDVLYPAQASDRPRPSVPEVESPFLGDVAAAAAWLDAERACLTALAAHPAAPPGLASDLSAIIYRYLLHGGYHAEALAVQSRAQEIARHAGNRSAEAHALTSTGVMYYIQGRLEQALRCYLDALESFRQLGDINGQARAVLDIGDVRMRTGSLDEASCCWQEALELFRTISHLAGQADALANLGGIHARQGRHDEAISCLRQALDIHLQAGNRSGEADTLKHLGDLHRHQGDPREATAHYRRALATYQVMGHRIGEADTLNGLGDTLLSAGDHNDAATKYMTALAIATQAGDRYQQARAHAGIAEILSHTGDSTQSARHRQQAQILYAGLRIPEQTLPELRPSPPDTAASSTDPADRQDGDSLP